jgi:predicted dinucleotide-binding enzyme
MEIAVLGVGHEQAKPAVAVLIADAGFEPLDLGGIEDSQ